MPSRRSMLVTGSAALLIAGTGSAAVLTRDAPTARAPWAAAGSSFGDIRLDALAYAILAPNPHNRQPWLVTLEGEDRLTLSCQLDRRLPATDPFDRQIAIGLGAFLELLRLAAAARGYRLTTDPFPDGEPEPRLDDRPIARARFVADPAIGTDPLFAFVPHRRTNRQPFRADPPVTTDDLSALLNLAGTPPGIEFHASAEPALLNALKPVLTAGWEVEVATGRTHAESLALTRIGAAEVAANPDGISLYGPMMEAWHTLGMLSHTALARPGSLAAHGEMDFYSKAIDTARGFAWLVTPGNRRIDQLQAGAAWLRLHLAATARGLAFHPLSQVLQEFPEMSAHFDQAHTLLGVAQPARIQGLFRLGHANTRPRPAPRWPLESRLVPLP